MTNEWLVTITQDGQTVARCYADNESAVRREGNHYLLVYQQDGPTEMQVWEKRSNRWAKV